MTVIWSKTGRSTANPRPLFLPCRRRDGAQVGDSAPLPSRIAGLHARGSFCLPVTGQRQSAYGAHSPPPPPPPCFSSSAPSSEECPMYSRLRSGLPTERGGIRPTPDFDPAQYGRSGSPGGGSTCSSARRYVVGGRDGRLVGPRTPGMVRPCTRSGWKTAVDQSC